MLIALNYHYIREDFTSKYQSIFGLKPQEFEHQLIELSKYGGWFCLSFFIFGMVSLIIYLILVQGFDISIPGVLFTIFALLMSFLSTMFMFMIRKAKERFGTTNWRDFWMAFGYPFCIYGGYNKRDSIDEWLDENIPRLYRIITRGSDLTVIFKHKEDAMAFKLRWA